MTTYTIKPSPDLKKPGLIVTCPPDVYAINGIIFEAQYSAEAYCDRLNKLFGEVHE